MLNSPIYTTEPMATRALAAEIRHRHDDLVGLLRDRSGVRSFGQLIGVSCEASEHIDVELEFDDGFGGTRLVGIEAKFDHELTREQVSREAAAMDHLFVLVAHRGSVPDWLASDFPGVSVISWEETLRCFPDSRILLQDIASIRLLKVAVEARLNALRFDGLEGWSIRTARGGSGMPSLIFESPALAAGRTIRGQLEVSGRRMPDRTEDVRFTSHFGISVPEDVENYFDPESTDAAPGWIDHLRTLHREVLRGEEDRYRISRRAPGASGRELGRWKTPLAVKHLGADVHLAKGYTDGWAIGPKTTAVSIGELDELAWITAEVFRRWFEAEAEAGTR
nr:hypothetical protein [Microbacterium hydrocarbonoxydans]